MILIRNVEVYAPEYLGRKDVLIGGNQIIEIGDEIQVGELKPLIIEGNGKLLFPGFIDAHVHITGGGGEGGFDSRTPEVQLTDLTTAGVTTVVGCLGTDGYARSMGTLIAKAKALKENGLSAFVYTGSYQVPVRTLTESITSDLMFIDEVIGVGEIAIADHRSSHPTVAELERIASEAKGGGLLAQKGGIVNVHLGDGREMLSLILEVLEQSEIPITQFYPTHMNRNPYLFEEAIQYALKGGYVDFTTTTTDKFIQEGEVPCYEAVKRMLEAGVDISRLTFTSDGQGSLPDFDEAGNCIGQSIGNSETLYKAVVDTIRLAQVSITDALRVITQNPAEVLKLKGKGRILKGYDADLVLVDQESLEIDTVIANAKIMVKDRKPVVWGMFEKGKYIR